MGSQEKIKLALQSKNQELIGSGIKTKSISLLQSPWEYCWFCPKEMLGPRKMCSGPPLKTASGSEQWLAIAWATTTWYLHLQSGNQQQTSTPRGWEMLLRYRVAINLSTCCRRGATRACCAAAASCRGRGWSSWAPPPPHCSRRFCSRKEVTKIVQSAGHLMSRLQIIDFLMIDRHRVFLSCV